MTVAGVPWARRGGKELKGEGKCQPAGLGKDDGERGGVAGGDIKLSSVPQIWPRPAPRPPFTSCPDIAPSVLCALSHSSHSSSPSSPLGHPPLSRPMSASPQPPPPATIQSRDDPVAQTNGSPPASSSPAQLATLLAKSLGETESLKAELANLKRRADKAERLLATFQSTAPSPTNGSPPGTSQGPPAKPASLPEAARKAILDAETRAERAEQTRDELEARLRVLQDQWVEIDRYYAQTEVRLTDVRQHFSRIVADGGGSLIPVSSLPVQNTVYLPSVLQQPLPLSTIPSRSHASSRSSHRLTMSSQPFPAVALPPPPSASSSRVRPRAGSMDAGYNGVLSGPGAPPPAKRPRSDRDDDRSHGRRYSLSVSPAVQFRAPQTR